MALKQPVKTTTNTTSQQSQTAQLHLPAPQIFDLLPPLHELLARVDAYHNQGLQPAETAVVANGAVDIGAAYTDVQPLEPKEFPTAVLEIKSRIRRALRELEKLPDMERTVEEQDAEIQELELRTHNQREMLRRLGTTVEALRGRLG